MFFRKLKILSFLGINWESNQFLLNPLAQYLQKIMLNMLDAKLCRRLYDSIMRIPAQFMALAKLMVHKLWTKCAKKFTSMAPNLHLLIFNRELT